MCEHSYRIPTASNLEFCIQCKTYLPKLEEVEEKQLVMPPNIYTITEKLWERIKPWKLLPFALVQKYGWYMSMINGVEYLVMPVQRMGESIYFSARRLSPEEKYAKYLYPTGVKKSYWVSSEMGNFSPVIVITEGVADAVYCSSLGTSVALLGSYYNGSLDNEFAGRHIAIAMDCDAPGILAAMRIMGQLKNVASKKIVMLPNKCDPTDIPFDKLRELVYNKQGGIVE